MTLDPMEFLDLSTKLFIDKNYEKEAKYRTCTSRAYYAAHLFTKEKLEKLGFAFPIEKDERKGVIHDKVIVALMSLKEKDKITWGRRKEKKLWQRLKDLRDRRGDADYILNINFRNMEDSVRLDITAADDIIKKVDKLTISDF